jgi:hypothetical protein
MPVHGMTLNEVRALVAALRLQGFTTTIKQPQPKE